MFIIEHRKILAMLSSRIKFKFFVWFASMHGHIWTSICDKNGTKC
jgi:hypothetical protein